MPKQHLIHPVILSGGAGTRLWPVSRLLFSKQLLSFNKMEFSLLQETVIRLVDKDNSGTSNKPILIAPPSIICGQAHHFIIERQLEDISVTPSNIILEPAGRNTAPAAATASICIKEQSPEYDLILMLPSDHVIQNKKAFMEAIAKGAKAASEGKIVTFGITTDYPATGYGYINADKDLKDCEGCKIVQSFTEKPDEETARKYHNNDNYYWNSGIFLFSASSMIEEMKLHRPDILELCQKALQPSKREGDNCSIFLDNNIFASIEGDSIDYAIMEHTDKAVVVPVDMGWSDVGSWEALWDIGDKDENGNVTDGDIITHDVKNSLIRSDGRLVAAVGLENTVIVSTDDAVLVANKDRTQDVSNIVNTLKRMERSEYIKHNRVIRPWGYFESIYTEGMFQVKKLFISPGEILSLQYHNYRAEHWVTVQGKAHIIVENREIELSKNNHAYIPKRTLHRIENRETEPLVIVEIQYGSYLGEDDIVRLEDRYDRLGE
ncbi:MAG: mannose-1-phosphate guanylyltransferase/mannose-6-phosphate isomerase [Alphaproteobacteria bacterium]|nr:mannose-1-phosphate guanylyltransferase/mannose-6-phosphate isomerase [Alphaproteobacteria bacterium]